MEHLPIGFAATMDRSGTAGAMVTDPRPKGRGAGGLNASIWPGVEGGAGAETTLRGSSASPAMDGVLSGNPRIDPRRMREDAQAPAASSGCVEQ